ncbi:hypothetical protein [Deinococcus sp. 6GRE01]|uniref:hypothetical protein n=1 Tax=Deinococcus sp. 6GRE01 TaxID=2745873 RepID=UPI001E4AE48D|nr:hypothetical protein [Deinococcus sp. 6GRE01]MCD0159172.1 hypothetical protein [Deinococcus sp. 6GRE01]
MKDLAPEIQFAGEITQGPEHPVLRNCERFRCLLPALDVQHGTIGEHSPPLSLYPHEDLMWRVDLIVRPVLLPYELFKYFPGELRPFALENQIMVMSAHTSV